MVDKIYFKSAKRFAVFFFHINLIKHNTDKVYRAIYDYKYTKYTGYNTEDATFPYPLL